MQTTTSSRRAPQGWRTPLPAALDSPQTLVPEAAPAGASHVGFVSDGEISPGAAGGASDLHNQTMTVTVFSEA